MDEFHYGTSDLEACLAHLRPLDERFGKAESLDCSASELLLTSTEAQAACLDQKIQKIARLKVRRLSDWLNFLKDVNLIFSGSSGQFRKASAVLKGPEPWMAFIAPPEELVKRTSAVVSKVTAPPITASSILAIFPSIIFLHPFRDGNGRTALALLLAMNQCYPVLDSRALIRLSSTLRNDRRNVVAALSQIRVFGDFQPYERILIKCAL